MLFDGDVAIVAGAGMGLGRAAALALAANGARVVVTARRGDRIAAIVDAVQAAGGVAHGVVGDVGSTEDCQRIASTAVDVFGRVDVLVANAAHPGTAGGLLALTDDEILDPLRVNLLGTLNVVRSVEPLMRARGEGRIVLVGSLVAERVVDRFGAYAISKAALTHAGRYLARELGPAGIRVNSVLPGTILGRSVDRYLSELAERSGRSVEHVRGTAQAQAVLASLPTPADVAGSIVYLASSMSAAVTGQAIAVNAGQWDGYAEFVAS